MKVLSKTFTLSGQNIIFNKNTANRGK